MNNTGVFISHHSNSTINLVLELSNVLQAYEIEHWYAERDIKPMDNYTEVIPLVIEKSELLVLLLNKESNVSKQVLREVQCALRWKIPVMIARLDDCEESQSIAYIGSTAQYVDLRGQNKVVAAQSLGEIINAWKNGNNPQKNEKKVFQLERAENLLDFYGDEGERKRLTTQRNFVYEFACEHYDSFISSLQDGTFLDINQPIGSIGVVRMNSDAASAEMGYCIGDKFWHQGYTSEALSRIMKHLFEVVGFNRISAIHDIRNPHSGDVMKKCGMKYEGTVKEERLTKEGQLLTYSIYAALRTEWKKEMKLSNE